MTGFAAGEDGRYFEEIVRRRPLAGRLPCADQMNDDARVVVDALAHRRLTHQHVGQISKYKHICKAPCAVKTGLSRRFGWNVELDLDPDRTYRAVKVE